MKDVKDLIPWKTTDLTIRPYDGFWVFNPSICFDGQLWRVVLRCCDYAMPGGKTIRSPKAGPGHQSKNAMIILDPATWHPAKIHKMRELDEYPRTPSANVGYEDMRIFRTDSGGLQGIAASLHLKREVKAAAGGAQHQPPEQVLLSFDAEYNIVKAQPIRGDGWSSSAQKNWSPFTDCVEPRFIYSIGRGSMFDARGPVHGDAAVVRPSVNAGPVSARAEPEPSPVEVTVNDQERVQREQDQARAKKEAEKAEKKLKPHADPRTRIAVRGGDVAMVRGRRASHDTVTTRPSYGAAGRVGGGTRINTEAVRGMSAGRTLMPRYEGLRGGTQLVRVADDTWLGIGHEMRYERGLKFYFHTFYTLDSRGKLTSASEPLKLALEGIEFAAGLAIDGDRAVVSFGVDDFMPRIGETSLSAVMGLLRPVGHE